MGWPAVLKRCDRVARIGLAVLVTLTLLVSLSQTNVFETSAAGTRSVRQAFFYTPPTDGTSVSVMADRSNFIILTQGQERYRDEVRGAGFAGSVLQYIVFAEVEGPGPYADASAWCDASFTPLKNQVADQVGDFCAHVHPNEDWFLHNGAGNRIYGYWDGRLYYHMNPASAGWRNFALARMQEDLASLGYDGIFLDNVSLSMHKTSHQLANSDGVIREFGSESAFRDAWIGYLGHLSGGLRSSGKLWANMVADPNSGTSWDAYLRHLDGGMFEAFATGYSGLSVENWDNNLRQAESALASGKGVLMVGRGSQSDTTRQTFALASYLLVSQGQNAYFRYGHSGAYSQWWQFGNYDVELGAPSGPRYRAGWAWRRDFECGYVTVDPAARTSEIVETSCGSASPAPAPPAVTLDGIANGATVSDSIEVEAVVSSVSGVDNVRFLLDGQSIDVEHVAPFFLGGDSDGQGHGFDTRQWSDGAHTLKAVATNDAGQQGSAEVTLTVANTAVRAERPKLAVEGVSSGATVSGRIKVEALASSEAGIREVRFILDGQRVDTESVAPFWLGGDVNGGPLGFDTTGWTNGTHTFRVSVIDRDGRGRAVEFPITVRNGE